MNRGPADGEGAPDADAVVRAARAARSDIALDEASFRRHLSQLGDVRLEHAGDVLLAAALVCGERTAVACFERECIAPLAPALHRMRLGAADIDEVAQRTRQRLLIGEDGPPRIARYGGRGPLRSWVRSVAVRVALDLLREQGGAAASGDLVSVLPAAGRDPQAALLAREYGGAVESALREAIAALPAAERLLLSQYYIDGLTGEALGRFHRAHPVTVMRRIARARERIARATRKTLRQELGLIGSDLDSVLRLVASALDASICRSLLAAPG